MGAPEQVAEQMLRLAEAAGDDVHYIARLYWPGMDSALQREVLHVWAEEVAPLLR
jgi:alkanesulfonate monooxygenase SsuD/methylene tetrahydromethanopterin reductase-like flavin-dependent oxidoreductase (luciferase family)